MGEARWLVPITVLSLITHYPSSGSLCVQSTPLIAAIAFQNTEGLKALLGAPAAQGLDLEKGLFINNATPLSVVRVVCVCLL